MYIIYILLLQVVKNKGSNSDTSNFYRDGVYVSVLKHIFAEINLYVYIYKTNVCLYYVIPKLHYHHLTDHHERQHVFVYY